MTEVSAWLLDNTTGADTHALGHNKSVGSRLESKLWNIVPETLSNKSAKTIDLFKNGIGYFWRGSENLHPGFLKGKKCIFLRGKWSLSRVLFIN